MYQLNKLFVHFWLVFTIASLAYAFYLISQEGFDNAKNNLFIPAIAFFWWLFRRAMVRRMERNMNGGPQKD